MMRRVWVVLLVASVLAIGASIPSAASPGLIYTGPLFDKYGPTPLSAFAGNCWTPIPGVPVGFNMRTLWNTCLTFGPAGTDVLGCARLSASIPANVYDLHVFDKTGQIRCGESVLTVYNCADSGIFAGGKLDEFCYGRSPNVKRSICPRDVLFGLEYRTLSRPYTSSQIDLQSHVGPIDLGCASPSALLLLDNDNPNGPVKVWSTDFQAYIMQQKPAYGILGGPTNRKNLSIIFAGYAKIDDGTSNSCIQRRFCAELTCNYYPITNSLYFNQGYSFKLTVYDVTAPPLYEIPCTCIECGGVFIRCARDD